MPSFSMTRRLRAFAIVVYETSAASPRSSNANRTTSRAASVA